MDKEPSKQTVEVALDLPVYGTYHYLLPPELHDRAQPGMRLLVPVARRKVTGYLLRFSAPPPDIELKNVEDLLDDEPLFDPLMQELLEFAADYYFYPLGEVIKAALPAGINIETRQKLNLTPTGEAARQSGLLRGPRGAILQAIEPGEELSIRTLQQRQPLCKQHTVRELIRSGFLESQSELTRPRVRPRTVRVFRPAEGISLARRESLLRRSPRQLEVFQCIERLGEATALQIREEVGEAGGILRTLLKKGLLDMEEMEIARDPFFSVPPQRSEPYPLTADQQEAFAAIEAGLYQRRFQRFLLHGVTGSGKTEIYLQAIQRVIEAGRQAIVLVPEIALTPLLVSEFRGRLGENLAVLHSGLSERERLEQWWRIRRGEVTIAIGARSAIFAPFSEVGMIVVDEEHESSYKQEGRFPYHARNLALMRGKIAKATVVLGSATPSMETYTNARNGKLVYLSLPERIQQRPLPPIEVLDLRTAGRREGGIFTKALREKIEENLENKAQTILFLNRRGYHTCVLCQECGYTFRCVHCSVTLTHHRSRGLLVCHYCGYAHPVPDLCPQCQTGEMDLLGLGTEKVENAVKKLFPEARVERLDRDITARKGALQEVLERFSRQESDILIGTQMVAKGHDFPGVTLVGVLLADLGMNLPDFRSAERTFQVIMQVAGRAGRGDLPGQVLVQSFNPDHFSIRRASHHDYFGFFDEEAHQRQELDYPPFGWLVALRFEGEDPRQTRKTAEEIARCADKLRQSGRFGDPVLLGPAPAPVERIKRRYRWQILLKSSERRGLHELVWELIEQKIPPGGHGPVKILVDADPLHML